jgi:glutathione S-transferase
MSGLILYGETYWFSPFVFAAYVALLEKELPFEERTFDLFTARDHLSAEFRRASITGKVPTLVHDGFWLGESSAIVEYLDESFPHGRPLLPTDRKERARVRQVMGFLRTGLEPLREERPTHTMFYSPTHSPLSPNARQSAEHLVEVTQALLAAGGATIASQWSMADAELAFMLHRLILNGDSVPAPVADFARTQWGRPSVQRFVKHARPEQFSAWTAVELALAEPGRANSPSSKEK